MEEIKVGNYISLDKQGNNLYKVIDVKDGYVQYYNGWNEEDTVWDRIEYVTYKLEGAKLIKMETDIDRTKLDEFGKYASIYRITEELTPKERVVLYEECLRGRSCYLNDLETYLEHVFFDWFDEEGNEK